MKIGLIVVAVTVGAVVAYWIAHFVMSVSTSRKLVERTQAFENISADTSRSMLVLGDSTAVGVGADLPEDSVPGRVASAIGATYVENHAEVGAVASDLASQASSAKLPRYRLILIQIGANDMVRFHAADDAARTLQDVLKSLPPAEKVVAISAGDLGAATIFPRPLRYAYSRVNRSYHASFARAAQEEGVVYVDLSKDPNAALFWQEPKRYLAADNFHLSSDGYGLWFEAIKPHL